MSKGYSFKGTATEFVVLEQQIKEYIIGSELILDRSMAVSQGLLNGRKILLNSPQGRPDMQQLLEYLTTLKNSHDHLVKASVIVIQGCESLLEKAGCEKDPSSGNYSLK